MWALAPSSHGAFYHIGGYHHTKPHTIGGSMQPRATIWRHLGRACARKDETAETAKSAEQTLLCVLRVLSGSFLMTFLAAALVVTVGHEAAAAQWPDHPSARIPRTAAGKPDLSAPVARTPDGK